MHRVDGQFARRGCFCRIFGGNKQRVQPGFPRGQCHGQHAGDAANLAVQRQFSQKSRISGNVLQLSAGAQNCQKDGKVVYRTGLFDVRGSQIDGDAAGGPGERQIFQGTAHPVGRFFYGAVRQTDDRKLGQAAAHIRLYTHSKTGKCIYPKTVDCGEHSDTNRLFDKMLWFQYIFFSLFTQE